MTLDGGEVLVYQYFFQSLVVLNQPSFPAFFPPPLSQPVFKQGERRRFFFSVMRKLFVSPKKSLRIQYSLRKVLFLSVKRPLTTEQPQIQSSFPHCFTHVPQHLARKGEECVSTLIKLAGGAARSEIQRHLCIRFTAFTKLRSEQHFCQFGEAAFFFLFFPFFP